MNETVKRLRDRRLNVWEQAKKIADKASDENRAFTGEEEAAWQTANAEMDALDSRIKAILEGEQRAKDIEDSMVSIEGRPVSGPVNGSVDAELRAFLRGDPGAPRTYEVPRPQGVSFRDLTKLSGAAGADLVPTTFYARLQEHLIETAAMLQAGPTVLETSSGEIIEVPKTLTHTTVTTPITEASAITETDPTFDKVNLGAFKYAVMIQVSRELLADSGVGVEDYLARSVGRAIGNGFGQDLVTGAGTTEPRGVVLDATLGKTGGTGVAGVPTGDELIDLFYSVIGPYRASSSCHWMMRDATVAALRKIKGSDGHYLFQPALTAGTPDTLMGKSIITDPNVAAMATSAKSVLFGDFSTYFVRLAGGFRFERSDDFAFSTDLVSFRGILRGDGALVDLTGSVKYYAGGAS